MRIRAAVLEAISTPVVVDTLDLAPPQAGEVLVRMGAAGVCHSDQHSVTGHSPTPMPCVLGHEGTGEVVEVGPRVETVRPGDRVVLNWRPSCRMCFYCHQGQSHLCPELVTSLWDGYMADGTSRLSRGGEIVYHYSGVSTWAEYTVVPEVCCTVVDAAVPFEVAALIGCGVATGVGAALNRANLSPGSHVVAIGAGGVGLSVIMGAVMAGARKIIAVDRQPTKRELAMALGATEFLVAGDSAVEQVVDITGGRGADVVFEAIGSPRLQETWIDGVRPGGTLVLVGVSGMDETSAFNCAALVRSQRTIKGSYFTASDPDRSIRDLCAAYLDGRLPVDRLISKRVGIEETPLALDAMLTGTEGRVVIVFD